MKSGSNSPRLQSQSSKFPGLFITTQNKQTIKESNFEDALFWRTGGRDEGVSRGRGRAAFEGHPPAAHASVCGTARCRIQYGGGSVKTIIPLRPPEVHRDPRAMIATISQICLFCSPPSPEDSWWTHWRCIYTLSRQPAVFFVSTRLCTLTQERSTDTEKDLKSQKLGLKTPPCIWTVSVETLDAGSYLETPGRWGAQTSLISRTVR